MPTTSQLGTEYNTFPLHFGGDGGYEIRIIAVADNTDVTVPAFSTSLTLHIGEFHVVDNTLTRLGFKVLCSQPCMVAQNVRALPADNAGHRMAGFLAVLIPEERATGNLIFASPRNLDHAFDHRGAISIITNTYPGTGLHLNDTSLADLNWQPVNSSSSWFSSVEIDSGFYHLYSTQALER